MKYKEIVKANGWKDENHIIKPGDVIFIPKEESVTQKHESKKNYDK